MVIGFGALAAGVMIAVGVVWAFGLPFMGLSGWYEQQRSQVLTNLSLVADLKKERLLLWLEDRKKDLRLLVQSNTVQYSMPALLRTLRASGVLDKSSDHIRSAIIVEPSYRLLARRVLMMRDNQTHFHAIHLADALTGLVLASTDVMQVGEYLPREEVSQSHPEGDVRIWTDVRKDPKSGRPFLILACTDPNPWSWDTAQDLPEPVAVAYIDTDAFVTPLLFTGEGMGATGDIVLVNQEAKNLISLRYPLADGTRPKVLEHTITAEPAARAARGEEGIGLSRDYRGIPVLAARRHISVSPGVGWGLVVKQDSADVFRSLQTQLLSFTLVALVGVLAVVALSVVIARRISRPVESLSVCVQELRGGNLETRCPVEGANEVTLLAESFNEMIERIGNWHTELEHAVEERTTQLHQSNKELAAQISERRMAQEALIESEGRMRLLIETSPIGIGLAQRERLVYANPALLRMYGSGGDPEDLVGRSLVSLCTAQDRERIIETSKHILEGNAGSMFYDITAIRNDETRFEARAWLTGTQWQGQPAVLLFITDVSEEKRLRSQLLHAQRMESLGTVAGGIAHDFNNLLQVMHASAELALFEIKKDHSGYSELHDILGAAKRAGELTQGLLTFSRQVESKMRGVDINEEIRSVVKLLGRTISKSISIQTQLGSGLHSISADPAQLQQVLMNLALNARDAMREGGSLVFETHNVFLDTDYCNSHLGTQAGDYVLLSVSDTGHGMDGRTMERIFEPFFSTKERGQGTGLGLSVVYGIIKNHGGNVLCYSRPGQGTTFKIYLPVLGGVRADVRGDAPVVPRGGTETILLVDDEEVLRTTGSRILRRFGYTVLTAADGEEGIELYRREQDRIDLVILDHMMPILSGRECMREILRINPTARVVVASGYAANGSLEQSLQEGARRLMRKPFEVAQLLTLVRDVLDEV